jgi:hypothetical protein
MGELMAGTIKHHADLYPVTMKSGQIASVLTVFVTPVKPMPADNRAKILLNLPGGGFALGAAPGIGIVESVPLAALALAIDGHDILARRREHGLRRLPVGDADDLHLNTTIPPGANTTNPAAPFYMNIQGLDLLTTPPTRSPSDPDYPPAIPSPTGQFLA